ncbi:ATP-dependent RNA helicase [Venturia nashicola]|uniref:ATP-dependent RNA helicase n=1 Tax=Venturia nashicola TaxID=86259 RepID=A0A4Z1P5H6_9PEZI|nr:ATP-dependent RNA helicase [Venturia nashicola]TLD23633.1 ATP-dependent RNA helicase [Venturia nashicola]
MAVLKAVKGIQVRILAGGKDGREYPCTDSKPNPSTSVTKYIEAVDGANFSIQITIIPVFRYRSSNIMGLITVDGQAVGRPLIRKESITDKQRVAKIDGIDVNNGNGWMRRKFVFKNIVTEASSKVDKEVMEKASKIGEINIRFYRVDVEEEGVMHNFSQLQENDRKIPEKALKGKAISCRAGLDEEIPIADTPKAYKVSMIDPEEEPFATFCFCYRSHKDLKVEMIIPRSLGPAPFVPVFPLEDRPIESLTLEEARERLRRQEQVGFAPVKQEHMLVKREHGKPTPSEDDSDGGTEIVQAPKRRRVKIETVDLTSD